MQTTALAQTSAQHLRADFSRREAVEVDALPEVASPEAGVTRRLIERDGGEVARATSIVRYLPGARFPTHVHDLGEEFVVLEGEFADEYGRYPQRTYVRNPPGSSHAPFTDTGCVLFVKLRHMDPRDSNRVVVETQGAPWHPGSAPGLSVMPLGEFAGEHTALVRWDPGTRFGAHRHWGGEEILVLEGVFEDEYGVYPQGSWLRSPHGSHHQPFSNEGCVIWVKVGHLPVEPEGQ